MKILLAVDGSVGSDTALESVLNESWPTDSKFCVVTVAEPMHSMADAAFGSFGQLAKKAQEDLDADIHKLLNNAVDRLKEKFGAANVIPNFCNGDPSKDILDIAQHWSADLIVIGSHGLGGYNDEKLGSICQLIMSHAPCSLRVVHYLPTASLEKKLATHKALVTSRLLLAVDRSVRSKLVIDSVTDRPWSEGTTVQVMTVVHAKSDEAQAEKIVKDMADKLENKFGKGKVTFHVLHGDNIRSLILQIAQDWPADLIVIGAHGQDKNVMEHFLGSTAKAIVDNAMCSVEIVR